MSEKNNTHIIYWRECEPVSDLNVDMHLVDVDDVVPPTKKLSDAEHHASLLSNFLLDNSSHFGVNEIFSFQKLVGNLDKIAIANLGRQTPKIFELFFQEFLRVFVFVWSYKLLISYNLYCLNLLYMFLSSYFLCFVFPR
jgi:hypothetical protein